MPTMESKIVMVKYHAITRKNSTCEVDARFKLTEVFNHEEYKSL